MSTTDELAALEAKITAAQAEVSKNEGALAQLMAQGEKEHGVKSLEEAQAKEKELSESVADLSAKYDAAVAKLKADYQEAVG